MCHKCTYGPDHLLQLIIESTLSKIFKFPIIWVANGPQNDFNQGLRLFLNDD